MGDAVATSAAARSSLQALFTAFIIACGITHLGGLLTLWWPYYTAEGIGTAMTAFISLASAVIFWLLMPQLAAIPSPAAAEAMNLRLLDEARRREEADRSAR